jgi:tetratricopeptide (TPR) repeat protein
MALPMPGGKIMQDKIRFYEEMMALEPGSKLFFPFAKLLMDGGRYEHARKVLEQGLQVHPEFMEARLLLLEVLHHLDFGDEAHQQGRKIIRLLGRYQGFWKVWEDSLEADKDKDLLLALRFVRGSLQGKPLRWVDILESGVSQLLQKDGANKAVVRKEESGPHHDPQGIGASPQGEIPSRGQEAPVGSDQPHDPAQGHESITREGIPEKHAAHWEPCDTEETVLADSGPSGEPKIGLPKDEPVGDQDAEEVETISIDPDVRTKTMADLLMKQEEYVQALEIYQELWASSSPGQEREGLEESMNKAKQRLAQIQEDNAWITSSGSEAVPAREPAEVVKTLAALADRLEERARS